MGKILIAKVDKSRRHEKTKEPVYKSMFWIRIRMFLDLPDPDPSIIKQNK
jgi:hypothetical protein